MGSNSPGWACAQRGRAVRAAAAPALWRKVRRLAGDNRPSSVVVLNSEDFGIVASRFCKPLCVKTVQPFDAITGETIPSGFSGQWRTLVAQSLSCVDEL